MRSTLSRFEHRQQQLLSSRQFLARMLRFAIIGMTIEVAVVCVGSLGFHYVGGLSWLDGALNATMVMTGNGTAYEPDSKPTKVFQIMFSLSSVIVFVLILSVMLAPVLHRVLHHFNVGPDDNAPKA